MTSPRNAARFASGLAVGLLALMVAPQLARADLPACGNVDVSPSAHCQLLTESSCATQCTPAALERSCAARLEQTCDTSCDAAAAPACATSCEDGCSAECVVNPDALYCTTDCHRRCESACDEECSSSSDPIDCAASCDASCDDHCDTQCAPVATAGCGAKCAASCAGACGAEANARCQVECQGAGYAQCRDHEEQSCVTQCIQAAGALFCDGSYIDVGDDLATCIDALNDVLVDRIQATVPAPVATACAGSDCTLSEEEAATTSCATSRRRASPSSNAGAVVAGLALALVARRRTRRPLRHRHVQ